MYELRNICGDLSLPGDVVEILHSSTVSEPITQKRRAERTVDLTIQVQVHQEFETESDHNAIELAKQTVVASFYDDPEVITVTFIDESVSSTREDVYR